MEYKAMQFEIIQTTNPCCWKWVVFLDSTKARRASHLRVPMPNWMPKTTNRWRADKAVLGTASAQILRMENGSKSRAVSFAVCLCWHARITAGGDRSHQELRQ